MSKEYSQDHSWNIAEATSLIKKGLQNSRRKKEDDSIVPLN